MHIFSFHLFFSAKSATLRALQWKKETTQIAECLIASSFFFFLEIWGRKTGGFAQEWSLFFAHVSLYSNIPFFASRFQKSLNINAPVCPVTQSFPLFIHLRKFLHKFLQVRGRGCDHGHVVMGIFEFFLHCAARLIQRLITFLSARPETGSYSISLPIFKRVGFPSVIIKIYCLFGFFSFRNRSIANSKPGNSIGMIGAHLQNKEGPLLLWSIITSLPNTTISSVSFGYLVVMSSNNAIAAFWRV